MFRVLGDLGGASEDPKGRARSAPLSNVLGGLGGASESPKGRSRSAPLSNIYEGSCVFWVR
jgi:hypothetical protein